jgi:guanylate kinase
MIITISGCSGSGKDAIVQEIVKRGYEFIVSHSTRPMREGESEGNPYHFVTEDVMLDLHSNNKLLEIRRYDTGSGAWYYGTPRDKVNAYDKYVVIVDLEGVESLRGYFGSRIKSFHIDVAATIRLKRAKDRDVHFDMLEWGRRLVADHSVFTEDNTSRICDFSVKNETSVEDCVQSIMSRL